MNFKNNYTRLYVNRLRDVFGAGAIAQGAGMVAQAGATIAAAEINKSAQEETNEMNYKIHQEDNEFAHDEAQIAREWDSPVEVMKRNQEAGLNPVLAGDNMTGGAHSSPVASPAPAIPMQTPQINLDGLGQAISGALQIAEIQSRIRNNDANTNLTLENAKIAQINGEMQPQILAAQLEDTKASVRVKNATCMQIGRVCSNLMAQTYRLWSQSNLDSYIANRDTEYIKYQVQNAAVAYRNDVDKVVANLTSVLQSDTVTIEDVKRNINSTLDELGYQNTGTNTDTTGWSVKGSVGGEISAGLANGLPSLGGKVTGNISGGYNSQSQQMRSNTESSRGQISKNDDRMYRDFKSSNRVRSIITAAALANLYGTVKMSEKLAKEFVSSLRGYAAEFDDFASWFSAVGNVPQSTPGIPGQPQE